MLASQSRPGQSARARRNPRFASDSIGRDLAPTVRNAGFSTSVPFAGVDTQAHSVKRGSPNSDCGIYAGTRIGCTFIYMYAVMEVYARMELKYDCCVNSLWYIYIIGGTGEGGWARQVVLHLVVWYDGQVNSILRKQSVTYNSLLASSIPRMVYGMGMR